MVANVTSLTRNGLRDWIIQRVTAVYLALYVLGFVVFFYMHPQINAVIWQGFFAKTWVQVLTLLAMLSILLHSWVGLWTVCTDYIKCSVMRLTSLSFIALLLLGYVLWAIKIIWGL